MEDELGKQDAVAGAKPAKKNSDAKAKIKYVVFAIIVIAIVLIASMAVLYSNHKPEVSGPLSATTGVTNTNITAVGIPLTSISQNATWYDYNISGSTVRFFAVEDGNGLINTAFDECWMCFNVHLGYAQEGSSMLERCCNMLFPIDQITVEYCSGMDACHPILLPSSVVGDQLVIQKTDLARQRFTFLIADETVNVTSYNSTHIAIPLGRVSGNATWYQYDVGGAPVRFFALKDPEGTVHIALDECPKCYSSHQGFRQEGTAMVENHCNMPFSISNITAAGCSGTSCHPVYLADQVIGDQVVIAVSDLAAGAYMFG